MSARSLTIEEILEMPEMPDIKEELNDPRFTTRQHHSRATAALGCKGPLCKKVERDKMRQRNEERAARLGQQYIPKGRAYDRDELFEAVFVWHLEQIKKRKLARHGVVVD